MERRIDLQTWERREVFSLFGQGYSPYYDVTVPVDVTELVRLCKAKGLSFYRAMLYVCTRAVNAVPAFLVRIRPDGVYRVDFASPSYTVAGQNGVFGIMTTEYIPGEGLSAFCARALAAEKTASGIQADEGQRDDLIFFSSVPWFSFTAVTQERPLSPDDSFPRILWGKYVWEGERCRLPLSMELNHRLLDGAHIQALLEQIQIVIKTLTKEEA